MIYHDCHDYDDLSWLSWLWLFIMIVMIMIMNIMIMIMIMMIYQEKLNEKQAKDKNLEVV